MKLTEKQIEGIASFIAVFIINFVTFLLAMVITDLSFKIALSLSIINALWMPITIIPIFERLNTLLDKKRNKKHIQALGDFFDEFEAEQKRLSKIYNNQDQIDRDLLKVNKHDWKFIRKILAQNGITKLYHFTDRSNLNSIKNNGGLLSWGR